ncbi:MAG TPA: SHOCT domain-containing protein [Opitutaceae bacterium]
MNTPAFRRLFAAAAVVALLAGCHSTTSKVVSQGDNLFTVTRESTNVLNRNEADMKQLAEDDAAKYCEQRGKQLQIVKVATDKPDFRDGFVSVTVTFRAVDSGQISAPAMGLGDVAPPGSSEFYRKLKELEDLRKSGVISEDEFEAAKKKILAQVQ